MKENYQSVSEIKNPEVRIQDMVYKKVMHWVHKCPEEISGMGVVQVIDGHPTVTEAFLFKQQNTGASTELDGGEIADMLYDMHAAKIQGDLRWWWHSHVNMSVFWSGTDKDTINQLGSNGWISATVFNKRNEVKSAILTSQPLKIFLDNVPTVIQSALPAEITAAWDKSYEEKVFTRKYSYVSEFPVGFSTRGKEVGDAIDWGDSSRHEMYEGRWRALLEDSKAHAKEEKELEDETAQIIKEYRSAGVPEDEIQRLIEDDEQEKKRSNIMEKEVQEAIEHADRWMDWDSNPSYTDIFRELRISGFTKAVIDQVIYHYEQEGVRTEVTSELA